MIIVQIDWVEPLETHMRDVSFGRKIYHLEQVHLAYRYQLECQLNHFWIELPADKSWKAADDGSNTGAIVSHVGDLNVSPDSWSKPTS